MKPEDVTPGQLVRYTGKFLRSIGLPGGPVNGLVIGRVGDYALVVWADREDERAVRVNAANLELDRRGMQRASQEYLYTLVKRLREENRVAPESNPIACALPHELTSQERGELPDWAFALPGRGSRSERKYPLYVMDGGTVLPSRSHAISAKARAKQQLEAGNLTQSQYNKIVAAANRVIKSCKGKR